MAGGFCSKWKLVAFSTLAVVLGILAGVFLPAFLGFLSEPRLEFDQDFIEFGNVSHDNYATHTFKVRNTVGKELRIADIRPSCGCMAVKISNSVIPPHQTVEVSVTLKVIGLKGRGKEELIFQSNDPVNQQRILNLYYTSGPEKFQFSPNFLNFGTIDIEKLPIKKSVAVIGTINGTKLSLDAIKAADEYISIAIDPADRSFVGLDVKHELVVTLHNTNRSGQLLSSIMINDVASVYSLNVLAHVRGHILATPRTLLFGPVARHSKVPIQSISLSGRTRKELIKVSSVVISEQLKEVIECTVMHNTAECCISVNADRLPKDSKLRKVEGTILISASIDSGLPELIHIPTMVFLDASESKMPLSR